MTNCESELNNDVASTDQVEWPREPKQGVCQGIGVSMTSISGALGVARRKKPLKIFLKDSGFPT